MDKIPHITIDRLMQAPQRESNVSSNGSETKQRKGSQRVRQSWRRRQSPGHDVKPLPLTPSITPYPRWLVGGCVERRRWDDPDVESFLRRGVPVVLTGGCPFAQHLVGRWSFDYLAQRYPAELADLTVHFAPRSTTRFNRFYGVGLGKGGVAGMTFRQFAEKSAANEMEESPRWRFYMQAPLVWAPGRGRNGTPGGEIQTPCGKFFPWLYWSRNGSRPGCTWMGLASYPLQDRLR